MPFPLLVPRGKDTIIHTAYGFEYRPLRGPPLVTIFETQPDKSVRVSSPKSPSRRYMH